MSEMTAMEYLRVKQRLCYFHKSIMGFGCGKCPLLTKDGDARYFCREIERKDPEKAIAIAQKWAEEHLQKTMKQDFFEKFPNAPKYNDNYPKVCPNKLGYEVSEKCAMHRGVVGDCEECWNRPLEVE